MSQAKVFLTTEWRDLVMVNWPVPPDLLREHVPPGTQLDSWNGRIFVSLVAFRFVNARLLGLALPGHTSFEEVNLRFYVRRFHEGQWRRGVVFVKEIVPRACVALVARRLYSENFTTARMSHRIEPCGESTRVHYRWVTADTENSVELHSVGKFRDTQAGSAEEFFVEHYWGYNRHRDGSTLEFQVRHPRWQVAAAKNLILNCDFATLYGDQFGKCLSSPPAFAFLANGSSVEVDFWRRLKRGDARGESISPEIVECLRNRDFSDALDRS